MRQQFAEFTEYISPDGQIYHFDGVEDRFIMSEEGHGMPEIEYITQRGPFQHGETIIDYRLRPRTIQLICRRHSSNRFSHWLARAGMLNLLRPNRAMLDNGRRIYKLGTLRKRLPNGDLRDIKVAIQGGPSFTSTDQEWDAWGSTETIRFFAPDPTYYDPLERCLVFNQPTSIAQLVFPITFPIVFDAAIFESSLSVTYGGNWDAFPTIQIYGPIRGPRIENQTTGEVIWLDYHVGAGEIVTVVLESNRKLIYNNHGMDLVGSLRSPISNFVTFHIASDPEVPDGVQTFRATGGDYAQGSTQVKLAYFERYIGI